ncbi:MFS transporter [Staphylothermus hellenicus]|uniref:Major facilitator superfamily MFS_1 n=1 Tax=Staphylothermus hellenicus (strain DSM 12710 / JCM 10830 / BK20S6-10-b1 / P8) TaxID=591019 RepID=D7DC22_STAHD|nr:MFS transporter [Staphylothermus hellenicus]ADI31719.1 major facilitator superfamily MFS_1 [Staphylothermus hellenicus DSM 12710]
MSGEDKQYLKKNILALGTTSLLTDISSESVYAVLPFYIQSLGYGKEVVGLVEGAGELVASIFKYLSGFIANKIHKYKLLALIGYSLSNFIKPFFSITKSSLGILLVKIIDRTGKGVRTSPRDTLLAASASSKYRGRAFGLHRALDTVGATLGPLLAIFLLIYFGYIGVFLFSIVPGLIAILILLFFVEEVGEKKIASKKSESLQTSMSPYFWLFVATVAASGLAGYTQAYLLLRAKEIGWSEGFSILFLVIANIVYASLAYPIGFISDVRGFDKLYPLVFVLQFIGSIIIVLFSHSYIAIVFFIIYGIYMAFHDTLTRIITSFYVKKSVRAKAYGYMHGTYGLSALIGYYILGRIYDLMGYAYAFTYSAIVAVIGFTLSLILIYKTKNMAGGI